MPRNAAGVYSLPNPPVVTDTTILSSDENTTRDDLAAEITNSLDRNGRGGMLAPFRIADGTLATPGLAFLNEPSTGLFRSGAGAMALVIGATAVISMTAALTTISTPQLALGANAQAAATNILLNAAAAQNKQLVFQTAGINRWFLVGASNEVESGGNAGSNFQLLARTDAGAAIDTPISIIRAAGGAMTFTRPMVNTAVGPHAFGGNADPPSGIIFRGVWTAGGPFIVGSSFQQTITGQAGASLIGVRITPTLNPHTSGTHALVAAMHFDAQAVPNNGALITNFAYLNFNSFTVSPTTQTASTLRIGGAPSGATTNYALNVVAGENFFGGLTTIQIISGGTSPTIPTQVGLVVRRNDITTRQSAIAIISGNAERTSLYFGDAESATDGEISYANATQQMQFGVAGVNRMNLNANGSLNVLGGTITGGSTMILQTTTVDGADNGEARLDSTSGGGNVARGAFLRLFGNESAATGQVNLAAGDVAGGIISFRTGANAVRLTINETGLSTFAGNTTVFIASASTAASIRLPHGVAPSAPVNGDMWTTTAGAFIRINGVTKTFTLT